MILETSDHILHGCALAKQVWSKLLNLKMDDPFFTLGHEEWWNQNLSKCEIASKFGTACWILWKSRNERVFEDGSVARPSGAAAAGGVLHDFQGRTHDTFISNLGICLITRAELMVIVLGMERAWNSGVRDLDIQTDSTSVVRILSNDTPGDHQHATIAAKFRILIEKNWKVSIKHIYREANQLADASANEGHSVDSGTHTVDVDESSIRYWERYNLASCSEIRSIVL
ncbi:Putative ribonuclease H protein At1g65750 [Linum perenne]